MKPKPLGVRGVYPFFWPVFCPLGGTNPETDRILGFGVEKEVGIVNSLEVVEGGPRLPYEGGERWKVEGGLRRKDTELERNKRVSARTRSG